MGGEELRSAQPSGHSATEHLRQTATLQYYIFVSTIANRASNLDPLVFSIQDLEKEGTKRLSEEYRDFYNGGAMDMITFVVNLSTWQYLM